MTATLSDLMTTKLITLSPDEDLTKADAIMARGRVRHLPVVNDGVLVGLITHRDLLRAQIQTLATIQESGDGSSLMLLPASERMSHNVMTATPDMAIKDAARVMLEHKLGCLPIVDDGKLVGLVTESDFLRWALEVTD